MKMTSAIGVLAALVFCGGLMAEEDEPSGFDRRIGGGAFDRKIGGGGDGKIGAPMSKVALTGRVLQVLPEGLLFYAWSSPYLLKGHPDAEKMVDGQAVNCYAVRTAETFKYTDTQGAVRTVRVYRFLNRRIGKR